MWGIKSADDTIRAYPFGGLVMIRFRAGCSWKRLAHFAVDTISCTASIHIVFIPIERHERLDSARCPREYASTESVLEQLCPTCRSSCRQRRADC